MIAFFDTNIVKPSATVRRYPLRFNARQMDTKCHQN